MGTIPEPRAPIDRELFEQIAETAFLGVLATDLEGRVVYANSALAAMLGWLPADLEGRRLAELVVSESGDGEARGLRQFLRRREQPAPPTEQLEARHRDGHRVAVEVSFTEVEVGGKRLYAGFVQEIGERLRGEEEVLRSRRQLQILTDVTRAALDADLLQLALDRIVSFVQETFGLAAVHMVMMEDGGEGYVLAASACARETAPVAPVGVSYQLRRGVVGRALRKGQAQLVLDTESDPDYVSLHPEVQSELVVPIRYHGRLLGALNIESDSPAVFTPENCAIFETIAEQVAGAVHHASVHRRLAEAKAALQESHRALRRANLRLARLSRTDDLTQLHNRRSFDEALQREWRRAMRSDRPLSLLILDLDRFKDLNDAAGHQAGDATLRAVSATVRSWARRAGEVAARYGGDELAVILPGTDESAARTLAERLRSAVQALGTVHPASGREVTASIGVATARRIRGSDPEALLLAADQALYRAKAAGRNRVETGRIPLPLERVRGG